LKEFNLTRLFSVSVLAVVALSLTVFGQTPAPAESGLLVYFGTYTTGKYTSKGVYVSRLDTANGTLTPPQLAAETSSPSFLAVHPTGNFIYSVNEVSTFDGKTSGAVSAFQVDRSTGLLKALNQQPSVGAGPAHLVVDKEGRNVLVANYGGGSVAVLPLEKNGKLKSASAFVQHTGSSVNPQRQKEPHAHSINLDSTGRYAYVADLGLDKILIYKFDPAKGLLTLNDPSSAGVTPGSGPRHFAFRPDGRFAFVINEMTCTITAFSHDAANGALREVHNVSALPPGSTVKQGQSGAEIQVHPSGKFLYASIRGLDSIAVFGIDQYSGRLTYIQNVATQGNTPRGFGIEPGGGYLLVGNQNSGTVVVFRIDPQSGKLTPTGSKIEISAPVSVKFVR
jgi:6-phosphogluconolactonase